MVLFALVCLDIAKRGKVMRIVDALVENILNILDSRDQLDIRLADDKCEETEEQKIQQRAVIQQALDDMHRQERIMANRS